MCPKFLSLEKNALLQESNGKYDEAALTPLEAYQEDLIKIVMDLKFHIEEAKRAEEVLKNHLIEKDELSLKMEMEI